MPTASDLAGKFLSSKKLVFWVGKSLARPHTDCLQGALPAGNFTGPAAAGKKTTIGSTTPKH